MLFRFSLALLSLFTTAPLLIAQTPPAPPARAQAPTIWAPPTDPKAQKNYAEAQALELHYKYAFAIDSYKQADKKDGNRCQACAHKVLELATATSDFKLADTASQELIALAITPEQQAAAHVERAEMLQAMGKARKKPECFAEGQRETDNALALKPDDVKALYVKGLCLADQQQDQAARQVFTMLLPRLSAHSLDHDRVARFAERPELVRARMAPAFGVTTIDGQRVTLDSLKGKVVLIDFWATWCGPCREALPHVRRIAQQFAGQPLVVLSISLDSDEQKWKDFVGKNEMTWMQVRDGGFTGPVAQMFEVRSIPHTFTIDSDGVLQDEHIGDGSVEGKLKKLVAQAVQREQAARAVQSAQAAPATPQPIASR
jgi:thiol-disulfide isomerase/thioredoxin